MIPRINFNMLIRIILSITFLVSAYSKIIAPGSVEVILIDQSIVSDRELAGLIVRIFIGFEIAIGLLFLQHNYLKRFTIPFTWVMLFVFTAYLAYSGFVLGDKENCGCFGNMIKMTPAQSILKNILLVSLSIILFRKTNDQTGRVYVPIIIIVVSLAGVFLFSPMKEIKEFQFSKYIYFEDAGRVDLAEGDKLLAVLSLDCEHCQMTAKDLAGLKQTFEYLPDIYFLFFREGGTTVDQFRSITNSNFPYHIIDVGDFFDLIGSAPPRIYWLKNGGIQKYWDDQFVKNIMLEFKK